jgi:hypothetical protein
MEVSSYSPQIAWQMTRDQLQMEMPKATFENWVQQCEFVAFEDGVFTIGTGDRMLFLRR